jgi:predicted AlkP superfamily phosphohydrolase/phosphomutase
MNNSIIEKKSRVIVLGLDGASWNIIKPLISHGKLPTIKKLIMKGVYGQLESTKPPLSVPAWKCYSTGKNPANLGVYSFLVLDKKKMRTRVAHPKDFSGKDIWHYLESAGKTSCIYKMLSTHPASRISGCMVSDLPFFENSYFPRNLKNKIEKLFGKIWIDIEFTTNKKNTYQNSLKDINRDFKVLKYLILHYNPDFIHISISHIDGIQHFFWKEMLDKEIRYSDYIQNVWVYIDMQIENLLNYLNKNNKRENYIMIISDHGFKGVRYTFNMGKWMLNKKYLRLTKKGIFSLPFSRFFNIDIFYDILEKIIKIFKIFNNRIKWGVQFKFLEIYQSEVIDFYNSKIIPIESQILYINDNCFDSKLDKLKFICEVISEIKNLKSPDGRNLVKEIYDGKKYYSNDMAPDILIIPNNVHLYNAPHIEKIWSTPSKGQWTGMHDHSGIFILSGPGVKKNDIIKGLHIYDIAPIILDIFGLPIPSDMDGKVSREIFEKDQ